MDNNVALLTFGDLLKAFRKQCKITQQELATRTGVHRNTIGAWETGDYLPETKTIVLELARLLHLESDDTRRLLEASLTSLSPYWQVPYQRNPFFTGRSAMLDHLHQHLRHEQAVALSQSYALSGLGGIGKTQLALEYIYRHAPEYHALFWVVAETHETMLASFAAIAGLLKLPEREEKEPQKLVNAVLRWLATHKEWLVVFDNVEDIATLKAFLPSARQGAIMITTRLHGLEGLAHTLELSPFMMEEGCHFLLSRARLNDPTGTMERLPPELLVSARMLVEIMDGLPLAIDQAGAYIERTGCSLNDYMQLFQTHQTLLLAERSVATDHPHSVVKTFLLSFEQLIQTNPAAADLLRVCVFLAPDAIPEELFTQGASHLGPQLEAMGTDTYLFNQAMGEGLRYSLLTRQPQNHTLSVHRLVQAVLLQTMSESERTQWIACITTILEAIFPEPEQRTWASCERLLPHTLACIAHTTSEKSMPQQLTSLLLKLARYLSDRASYGEAEPLYQRALHLQEQALGPEHPEVALILNGLAILYREQNTFALAESHFQRALHIREHFLGPEHSDVAATLNGLAILYGDNGRVAQAIQLSQRALHIQEQALGPDHPDVAATLNTLTILSAGLGNYEEAEPYAQRALQIREQILGPDHFDVATSLINLANLNRAQGKYTEVESLYQRALRIYEQSLGPDHRRLVYPLNNLGELYREQLGKYAEAESLYQRALQIMEVALGPEHPHVGHMLHNLGALYWEQGKYVEAQPISQRALQIWEQALGPNHPLVPHALNTLARLAREQSNYEEAESLSQRALQIWEQALGLDHPDVAFPINDLATLRREQGRYAEAETLYQRALQIREQALGPDHSETAETLYEFAIFYSMQGNHKEAVLLSQRALLIRQQSLGADHPKTLQAHKLYANCLAAQDVLP